MLIAQSKGEIRMCQKILNEIHGNAKDLPLECQEKILDVVKAMAFTKECVLNELKQEQKSA